MRPPPDDYVANGASRFQDVIKGGRVLGENGRKFPSPPPSSVADDSDEPIPTRFNAPGSRARHLPPPDSSSSRRPYPSPSPVIDRSEEKQRSSPSSNFGSSFAFGASDRNRGLSSPVVSSPVHGFPSSSSVRSSGRYSRPPSSAASSHGDDARSTSTLRLPPPPPPAPVSRNSNPYGSYASSDEDEVELPRPSSSSRPSQPTSSRFASPSLATVVTPPTPANNNSRRPDPTSRWSSTQASAAQTSQEDTDSAPESSEAESEAAPRRPPPQSRSRYPESEAVPSIHRNHRSNPSYAPQEDDSEAETDDAGYHRPQPQVANPRRRGAPPSPVDSEPPERQSGGYGYHSDTDGESVAAAFGGRHQKATAPAESDEEVGTRRRHGGGGGRPPIHRRDPSFSRTGSTFPFSDLEDDGGGSVRGSRRKEESGSGSGSDVDSTTSEEDEEEVGYGRGGGGGGSRRREEVPVQRNGGGGRRGEEEGMGAYGVAPAPRRGGVGAGQAPVEYSRRAARRLGR